MLLTRLVFTKKKIEQKFLLSILLVLPLIIFSQKNIVTKPLALILENIQKQHSIQFNYSEDLINDVKIKPPIKDLLLNEKLKYLEKNTQLTFVIFDKNFVLVKPKQGFVLCGYLKNKDGLLPITSAIIRINNKTIVSDIDGYFELKFTNLDDLITISYVGLKTIKKTALQLKAKNCKTIYMNTESQLLAEVVISNYLTKGIHKINNGLYEIDFNEFEILPGLIDNDVLQSVQAFPGIQSINETVSNINIRGGTHDQNLILWDQIKMYQSGHFFGLISMFNPQMTQKVSVRKNGTDVSMTDGVSGIISMQTSNKVNTKLKANIGLNLIDANGFIDLPISKKSSIQVAARKSISNFIKTPIYNEFFDRISQDTEVETNDQTIINSDKKFDFYDASFRWNYKINKKNKLRLSFISVFNKLDFNENFVINDVEKSRESSISQNSIAASLAYHKKWNNKLETTLEIYETDYKLKAINANLLQAQRFLQKNIISETSLKLKANYKINDRLQLKNGYHFVETKVTNLDDVDLPLYRLLVSKVIRTHGLFLQFNYQSLTKNTTLNLGARFNYIDKFDKIIIEPRLSFNQRFLTHFTFEILGEFKHQNTSQIINFQNDFLGIEKRRWQLANNDDIPIITSKQISSSINFNNNGWLVSADGYFKKINGITTQSQGFHNQYEFVKSSGSYAVNGLDFLLRKKISVINTWFSYSYMNNLYTFYDLESTSFPSNYDITHTISFGSTYTLKKIKIAAALNWRSGKPTTIPVINNEIINNEINYDNTNTNKLKPYLRADISAIYNFSFGKKTKATFGVSVINLFNNSNEINNFYNIKNNRVSETIQTSLGVTPNAALKIFF